jgi:phosphopantetheinyl transferase (holo-ACP synthase)
LSAQGAICQRLPFSRAYHTPLYEAVRAELREFYEKLNFSRPVIDVYSCATAAKMPYDPQAIRELALEQWVRRVRFRETIEAMYADGFRVFVEVGPRGNLTGFVEDILRGRAHVAVAANSARRSGITQLHHTLGLLVAHGMELELDSLYADRGLRMLEPAAVWGGQSVRLNGKPGKPLALGLPLLEIERPSATISSDSTPATGEAARAGIVTGYLRTMDQFLSMQREVMGAFLHSANGHVPASESVPPLIAGGRVVQHAPGREITVVRTFDVESDSFLRAHVLGPPRVSEEDLDLLALPVVPFALGVEVMAEVAAAIMRESELKVVQVKDARAFRWLALPFGRLTLQIRACVRNEAPGKAEAEVQVRELTADTDMEPPLVMRATVVFGEFPNSPPHRALDVGPLRACTWPPHALYARGERHGMFHGPAFQGVASIDGVGQQGVQATLRVASNELNAGELTAPLVLDAAGQVVGFWAADWLEQARIVFPVGFDSMHLYQSRIGHLGPLTCRMRLSALEPTRLSADLEVSQADGSRLLHVTGWEDRRFELPPRFFAFRLDPLNQALSIPVEASDPHARACRLELAEDFLAADGGVWQQVLAHMVLSRNERKQWHALEGSLMNRSQWLLGRAAAKDAARLLMRDQFGVAVYPTDVEISLDKSGLPRAHTRLARQGGSDIRISISHSAGIAIASAGS